MPAGFKVGLCACNIKFIKVPSTRNAKYSWVYIGIMEKVETMGIIGFIKAILGLSWLFSFLRKAILHDLPC